MKQQGTTKTRTKRQAGIKGARILLGLAGCLVAADSWAGLAQWSATNLQLLYGDNYQSIYFNNDTGKLDSVDDVRSVITVEHVNGWKYGDNFMFFDITNADRTTETATSYYGEISPRLSFGKMLGVDLNKGLVNDVLITTTAEIGEGLRNYLYGVAVDLNLPGFAFFQFNYYVRNEVEIFNGPSENDTGYQITLAWLAPFSIGTTSWAFEGFIDYAYDVDPGADNIIAGPRLLLDVGEFFGEKGALQAGIEYQIWRNKFAIDDIDEDVVQAMVKFIF
jgi:nucleoside-specific outer membrane channel protein Tsx